MAAPVGNRPAAFQDGVSEAQAEMNAKTPKTFTPTSVLHQVVRSANGIGASDAGRLLFGNTMIGQSTNGQSPSTYQANMKRYALPFEQAM